MLTHGLPWQGVVAKGLMSITTFIALMLFSLICGYFNWPIIFTIISMIIGFYIIITLIPLYLNLSRSFFKIPFILLASHIVVNILSFALHFKAAGLINDKGYFFPDLYTSIYFSITTFTTLGYGDFQPTPPMRLITSIEALSGMVSMTIGASLIWLWCQENIIPAEMAFFDADRINKKNLTVSRVRIRSIIGKTLELNQKKWFPTNEKGDSFFYNNYSEEWVRVADDVDVPEGSLVIGITREEET